MVKTIHSGGLAGSLLQGYMGNCDSNNGHSNPDKKEKKSPFDLLIEIAECAELFHTANNVAYANVPVAEHFETFMIESGDFREWLAHEFYARHGKPANAENLKSAQETLKGKAIYQGTQEEIYTRIAQLSDAVYLDLGNASREVVKITDSGWGVMNMCPVRFRRPKNLAPLPTPVTGGNVNELRAFVNVASDNDWSLLLSWIVAAFCGQGPYPILVLMGEQGSSKSTTGKMMKALIDPVHKAPLRATPKDEQDLAISIGNSHVIAFDNISKFPDWLSDGLCRIATGSGFATRKLYTNEDESIIGGARPICLNGIEDFADRADILDRALLLELPQIDASKRQDEACLWPDFEAARPRILGALLDAVSSGMKNLPNVVLEKKPRMADFAKWAVACESGLGFSPGSFMRAHEANKCASNQIAIEASPIVNLVRRLVQKLGKWEGTASVLLEALKLECQNHIEESPLPKNASALSKRLKRDTATLREIGIDVQKDRGGRQGERKISITPLEQNDVAASVGMTGSTDDADGKIPILLSVGS